MQAGLGPQPLLTARASTSAHSLLTQQKQTATWHVVLMWECKLCLQPMPSPAPTEALLSSSSWKTGTVILVMQMLQELAASWGVFKLRTVSCVRCLDPSCNCLGTGPELSTLLCRKVDMHGPWESSLEAAIQETFTQKLLEGYTCKDSDDCLQSIGVLDDCSHRCACKCHAPAASV